MLDSYDKLSSYQMIMILVLSKLVDAYTYLFIILSYPGNQDIWIMVILSFIYILIIYIPIMFLSNRYKGLSLIDIGEVLTGKIGGKILSLMLSLLFLYNSIISLALIGYFLGNSTLPDTPFFIVTGVAIICCSYSAYKGLSIHGRLSEIIAPITLLSVIVFTLLNLGNMDFKELLPILKTSTFKGMNYGALSTASIFYQGILLSLCVPQLKKVEDINKIFIYSIAIITVFYVIIITTTFAVFGVRQAQHQSLPYLATVQQISLLNFIERIEVIAVFNWLMGVFINFSLNVYFLSKSICYGLNFKNEKVLIIPSLVLIFIINNFTPLKKSLYVIKILSYEIRFPIYIIFILVIPLMLLIMYFIRGKNKEVKSE
ncbi:endospore germination permease [Clostridium sp. MSJ-11]|uniref:Endospore germination permease n=1 Tax=Clostridium mobile TaxID=2841512 RepID=A0ABS6EJC1_9CLOT|nr:endospore germination permease [Clostridium mobile]MBU5485310.1 endospore germination permease [Clostridium mobile]